MIIQRRPLSSYICFVFALALMIGLMLSVSTVFADVSARRTNRVPGATFTVLNTNDTGAGSLRAAIISANSNPGEDTITFNIPGSGVRTINLMSALPTITDQVTIDGYTQPGSSPNTLPVGNNAVLLIELNGTNAGSQSAGITVSANGTTISGLVINRFGVAGINIQAANSCVVQGNFLGTNPAGTVAQGNGGAGVGIYESSDNLVGGASPGARNLISATGLGVRIGNQNSPNPSSNNQILGNYIGTNASGTSALGNSYGVSLVDTSNNTIGGLASGAGNVISGNSETGVQIEWWGSASSSGNSVVGNLIGVSVTGAPLGSANGMWIFSAPNTLVEGNTIANNSTFGIKISNNSAVGNAIRLNSIYSNGILALDLGPDGVTPNDPGDTDTGPNRFQNYPVLSAAHSYSDNTVVYGTLNSTPNTTFTLDFFSDTACDPSGHGEARTVLGSTVVTTNGSGNATFSAVLPASVPVGQIVSATATDPAGNTSEFSACMQVTQGLAVTATSTVPTNTPGSLTPTPVPSNTSTRTNTALPPSSTSTASTTSTRTQTATATATGTPIGCAQGWNVIASPNVGIFDGLTDVDALASNDVWAVGSVNTRDTLTMHWDGERWNVIPSYSVPSSENTLWAVEAVAPNDVWAVGSVFISATNNVEALILHWNGTAWSRVLASHPSSTIARLDDLVAISANDIWAVGSIRIGVRYQTLTLHWDGQSWQHVPSPNGDVNQDNFLRGIDAVSSSEVWAAGTYGLDNDGLRSLILKWNGSAWSVVASPNAGSENNSLQGVAAISSNDVWVVGLYGSFMSSVTLTMHWNGTAWSIVSSPNPTPSAYNILFNVSAASATDVWAVGYSDEQFGSSIHRPLVLRWNGSSWAIQPIPNPGTQGNLLYSVDALSSNEVWAVGQHNAGGGVQQTFTVRYVGVCGNASPTPVSTSTTTATTTAASTVTPSIIPTGTGTPSPPAGTQTGTPTGVTSPTSTTGIPSPTASTTAMTTATPVGATSTRVPPTATVCPLQFGDVPADNTFYSQIRCLACRGIMGGYSDNTFRPNNDITRGQLSKIVANSAGFNEPVTGQTFEDVEPDNAFYVYVERMAGRGIIGGYNCGGPGEPCVGPDNRPYFRPNANATRGQISKIVSEARGYNDPQTGQTFEDVAVGSTFYLWIERLASRGIMGGYTCGGAGEPCGTGNKPYFRPNAKATRGQTSKIVANTFFPGCRTP